MGADQEATESRKWNSRTWYGALSFRDYILLTRSRQLEGGEDQHGWRLGFVLWILHLSRIEGKLAFEFLMDFGLEIDTREGCGIRTVF